MHRTMLFKGEKKTNSEKYLNQGLTSTEINSIKYSEVFKII